jgi:hypothetical protein
MADDGCFDRTPLLVIVRSDESGWSDVGRQPHDPAELPVLAGFLHTSSEHELIAAMTSIGYERFAAITLDPDRTTHWFGPADAPAAPTVATASPVA